MAGVHGGHSCLDQEAKEREKKKGTEVPQNPFQRYTPNDLKTDH